MSQIPVIWRDHPFGSRLHQYALAPGISVAEIVASLPAKPPGFDRYGEVTINGVMVPRERWRYVKPRAVAGKDIIVNLVVPLQFGGSSGSIWTTIATVAVAAAALFVTAGGAAPLLGAAFASGTFGALALGGAISVGGALAISALTPPPTLGNQAALGTNAPRGPNTDTRGGAASLSGNVLQPGGPIPRVIGTHRVYPALACHPLIDLDEDDEVVEAVFVLSGPHQITDIRNGTTPIADISEIESETKEGFDSDTALTLVTRQSKTAEPNIELSKHMVDDTEGFKLDDQTTPENSVPQWHAITVNGSPDEIWVNLAFPQGIVNTQTPSQKMAIPFRVRFRVAGGTTWTNLPEFHVKHSEGKPFQKMLKFKFVSSAPAQPTPPVDKAPYYAIKRVPMRIDRVIQGSWTNPNNAFNNNPTTVASRVATTGYIGADWSLYPRKVKHFEIQGDSVNGFVSGGTLTYIRIYGKNGAAPSSPTDGTQLYAYTSGNTTAMVKGDITSETEWDYVWAAYSTSAGTMYCSMLRFYDDNEFSWRADDYFLTGDGGDVMYNGAPSDKIRRFDLRYDRVDVQLQTASYPKGDYEIQIKRGQAYKWAQFDQDYYRDTMSNAPAGNWVVDYFKWGISTTPDYQLAYDLSTMLHTVKVPRVAKVWNEAVLADTGLAAIAIKCRKRTIESINCLASGYVYKWNGTGAWNSLAISSNPADHFRDVLVGDLNASALPDDLIDDANLLDWRAHCDGKGYQVNMVVEGRSAFDVLNALAGCGYARPRQSEKWGVMMDRDRAGESPVQIFSPANMRGFRWEKAFNRLPAGLRARFRDSALDYQENEIIVLREGADDDGRYEDLPYDGLVTEAEVSPRAEFDLAQMSARSTFYRGEAPIEWLVAQRGDLVGVQYDVIDTMAGWARIKSIVLDGGNIEAMVLNGTVANSLDWFTEAGAENFFLDGNGEDFFTGDAMGIAIRCKDGSTLVKQVRAGEDEDSDTVFFDTPFADPGSAIIAADCLVVSGRLGSEYKRMILADVTPKKGFTAQLTFVDEAPELHQ